MLNTPPEPARRPGTPRACGRFAAASLPPSSNLRTARVAGSAGRRARRVGLAFACAAALAAAGCNSGEQGQGGGDGHGGPGGPGGGAPPPMPVTVVKVAKAPVPLTIAVPGQAEGSREVEVRARVQGILERKVFDEGEAVKAGAPMYEIEKAPLEIALAQARAQLAQEQARYDDSRREEARLKPLAERRAVSQREYDAAVATRRTAEATRAAAQSRVRDAELNLSYSTVRAPIDGVTGRSLKSEGSLVSPGAEGLLTTISTVDPIWVRFALSEDQNQKLKSGQAERVRILGGNGQPLLGDGEINFSSMTIDPRLGTLGLRAAFPNPERHVLPGQFVDVQIVIRGREAWKVPQQAVMQSDQGRMVWVAGDDGKIAPRPIQTAEWVGKDWVVTGGLKDGDAVVIDNILKIRPGATVVPKIAGAEANGAGAANGADAGKGGQPSTPPGGGAGGAKPN